MYLKCRRIKPIVEEAFAAALPGLSLHWMSVTASLIALLVDNTRRMDLYDQDALLCIYPCWKLKHSNHLSDQFESSSRSDCKLMTSWSEFITAQIFVSSANMRILFFIESGKSLTYNRKSYLTHGHREVQGKSGVSQSSLVGGSRNVAFRRYYYQQLVIPGLLIGCLYRCQTGDSSWNHPRGCYRQQRSEAGRTTWNRQHPWSSRQ